MKDQNMSKEELLLELKALQGKYDSLRKFFDEETSERQRAQKALKESEDKYKIAFQTSRDSINITERDGTYIDINEGFTNITGYTREDVIGKLPQEINIWAIPEDLEKLVAGLKQKGFVENLESQFRCKDGSLKTAIVSANIIILNNELNILIVSHDITERKQMERLILKSKKQYDDLVSNIPVGVYVLHSKPEGDYAFDYVSPRMAEMLDISVEDLTSNANSIFTVIHPDDLEAVKRLNEEGILQKRPFDWNGRAVISGVVRWLHISSLPMQVDNGDILWNGLIVDITEQMLAKAEIELQNKELQKINAEKDKFFSIIAHDLRSPFNGFLGLTQIMAEDLPSLTMSEIQDIAIRMSISARNLYRLLDNLLEWSQIQQGVIRFKPDVIHLDIIMDGIFDVIQESAKRKGIALETHFPDGLVLFADANMLQSILRNLLSNALKFTAKGGNITISAKITRNNFIEISIQDTGIGMNKNLLDNLFRIDVQSCREGTEKEPSFGLGLLLCKEFVETQGGKLWVESEEGIGSTFHFTLPSR
ncbi:MAG: PAS domain S-box protein [Prolixibacteraceae bacterium]